MRRVMRAAAAGLLTAVLVACGQSTPTQVATASPSTSTIAPTVAPTVAITPAPTEAGVPTELQAIIGATSRLGSASIDFGVGFRGSSLAGDGDLASGGGNFIAMTPLVGTMEMDMRAAGLGRMELVIDGPVIYMRGGSFKSWAPNGEWIRIDTTSDHPNAQLFTDALAQSSDPWASLSLLLGATGPAETLPATTLDGIEVRHLRFTVDLDLSVERAPASQRDALLIQVADLRSQGIPSEFQADVWVDADDQIRRAQYEFAMPPLAGGGFMVLWYEFSDFGLEFELPNIRKRDIVDIEDVEF